MTYSTPSQQPKSNKTVPVLITCDVDLDLWIPCEQRQGLLNTAMDLCHSQGIRARFFFTAQPAEAYLDVFDKMRAQVHELGCYGLTHEDEEDYDQMSEAMQRVYIEQATERLQNLIGEPIRAFRNQLLSMARAIIAIAPQYPDVHAFFDRSWRFEREMAGSS